mmetsp:Transcript_10878/g.24642  ORF Transcript_10878/g.24642 Transcript_10878/m.24642 type:complete len:255 (+) Transcript_10878:50-814(+)|eukprot:CAMPEP_0197888524 /NCGR_PEP_ID=MMETSP1439-20131203/22034_1 /TAXON_ID=66791 /ORGANISM="Gonyaulax spinifera, Strain CCMP409" /LENGTH=254 /DNA_ID=CAMNT_0043508439 /DNA_START=43 /DNA_END=807 /DNA_ORIENTATION=+
MEAGEKDGAQADPEDEAPRHVYELLGNVITVYEGDAVLSNTGWRTWAGSWLLAKQLEGQIGCAHKGNMRRILDLSCGTGLAGISLACAGHEVVLCDLEVNVPNIRRNLGWNLPGNLGSDNIGSAAGTGAPVAIISYAWGAKLPQVLKQAFDIVLCGDLLFHVWSGRLHGEFLATLHELCCRGGADPPEFIFGGQVRSGRQERQILSSAARRLRLVHEDLDIAELWSEGCPLLEHAKYRLCRLRPPHTSDELDAV